jgi:hypothetical protein
VESPAVAPVVDFEIETMPPALVDQGVSADAAHALAGEEPFQLETAAQAAVEHASRHFAAESLVVPELEPNAAHVFDVDDAPVAGVANAETVEETFVLESMFASGELGAGDLELAVVPPEPDIAGVAMSEDLAGVLAELDFGNGASGISAMDAALGTLDEPDVSALELVSGELAVAAALDAAAVEQVPSVPLNLFVEEMTETRSPLAALERFLQNVQIRRLQLSEATV